MTDKPKEVVLTEEEHNKLVQAVAEATQAKSNLVGEIQDLRKLKQDAEKAAADAKLEVEKLKGGKPPVDPTQVDVAEIAAKAVEKVLGENKNREAVSNKQAAIEEFKNTNKEFHPDNDAGGLKYAALEKVLNKFNLEGVYSKEDFKSILGDAYKLLVREDKKSDTIINDFTSSPADEGGKPRVFTADNLSSKELKLINQSFGGDKEKYLKAKAKRPDYIDSLLEWMK